MVMCSNLTKNDLSFLFAKILFGMNVKGQRNPSCKKQKGPLTPNLMAFSFLGLITLN